MLYSIAVLIFTTTDASQSVLTLEKSGIITDLEISLVIGNDIFLSSMYLLFCCMTILSIG